MEEPSNELSVAIVAALVDSAAASAGHEYDIAQTLRQTLSVSHDNEQDAAAPGPASWTFWAYEYHPRRTKPARQDFFEPPILNADGTGNIPSLSSLPDEAIDWLAQLSREVKQPRALARLAHLLFLRKHNNAGAHARAAIKSYLVFAQGSTNIDAVDAVRIGLELSRRIGDAQLADDALSVIVSITRAALAVDRPAAGVVLGLLDTLVSEANPPSDIEQLVHDARAVYARDVHNADTVISFELRLSQGDTAAIAALWEARVALWIAAAEKADRAAASIYLQRAVQHARASDNPQLLERTTAKLQELRLDDLGLTHITVGMSLPRPHLDQLIRPVIDAHTWQEALREFARLGPVTGDADANRQAVRQQEQDFPLSRFFPPTQLGSDNLPRFSARTDDELFEYALVKNESLFLQLRAPVILEGLARIIADWPIPTLAELAQHFAVNPAVPLDLAAAIARSFLRFWAGDAEGAAFTITPRIEALTRNLLIQADVGIYRLQRQQSPGQYPGLRFLLDELLKRGLDASWHRFMLVLCAHVVGFNFRNELSHGFILGVDDGLAALLLQAAAYLADLNITSAEVPGSMQRDADKAESDQPKHQADS